ncbi:MAG: iron-sulfur cluster assembly scaffold protein [Pseudomonadales bacterium]
MSSALYQAEIKRLARLECPRYSLPDSDHSITLDNPLCGDRVTMDFHIQDGRISAQAHRVRGCLLCRASANLIAGAIPGTPLSDLGAIKDCAVKLLQGGPDPSLVSGWEALALFQPVANYKSRHECVLLPFRALISAAEQHRNSKG